MLGTVEFSGCGRTGNCSWYTHSPLVRHPMFKVHVAQFSQWITHNKTLRNCYRKHKHRSIRQMQCGPRVAKSTSVCICCQVAPNSTLHNLLNQSDTLQYSVLNISDTAEVRTHEFPLSCFLWAKLQSLCFCLCRFGSLCTYLNDSSDFATTSVIANHQKFIYVLW
jgi:hypothetical protein